MRIRRLLVSIAVPVMALAGATEARPGDVAVPSAHVMITPADLAWTAGPAAIPSGAKHAVIEGDPKQPGLFTMRLSLPASYKISPHWHPADEHITVISGTFYMGHGETFDAAKGKSLPAGSFVVMPARSGHFAFTKDAAVIQLHGLGPWAVNYFNPADDPRKAPAATAPQ